MALRPLLEPKGYGWPPIRRVVLCDPAGQVYDPWGLTVARIWLSKEGKATKVEDGSMRG